MPSYTARELERDTGFDRRTIAYYVQEGLLPKVGRRGPRTRYPKLVRDRLLFIRRVREAEEEGEVPAVTLSDMRKVFERVPPALIAGVADGRIAVTPELVAEPSTSFRAPAMRRRSLEERWGGEKRPIARMREPERRERGPRAPAFLFPEEESLVEEERGPSVQRESDVPPVFSPLPPGAAGEPGEGVGEDVFRESSLVVRPEGMVADRAPAYEQDSDLADSLQHLREVASRRNEESPGSRNTWTRIEISPDIVLSIRGITEEDEEVVERVRWAMARLVGRGTADP
ncbi:MAG: MerR family transcriptional regulator [Gemmatimonadetes bacterium]|nr:MerR family transcriptional regulator [Gemmatimonadota bacterium]